MESKLNVRHEVVSTLTTCSERLRTPVLSDNSGTSECFNVLSLISVTLLLHFNYVTKNIYIYSTDNISQIKFNTLKKMENTEIDCFRTTKEFLTQELCRFSVCNPLSNIDSRFGKERCKVC